MKTTRNIILGLILVAIGVCLAGDALDLFHFNLFFKGWWTLFLIVPAIIGLCSDKDKKGDLIVLIIGILLLLACRNIINFEIVWKLLLPAIIIVFGLSLIFKNSIDKEVNKNIEIKDFHFLLCLIHILIFQIFHINRLVNYCLT